MDIGANLFLREVRVWMRAHRLRIDLARSCIRFRELVFELDRRCLATLLVASCSACRGVLLARARAIVSHPEGTCWRGREEGWMRERRAGGGGGEAVLLALAADVRSGISCGTLSRKSLCTSG